jgi:CheY-like chemotaxis protein
MSKLKLLYVDDDADIREIAMLSLQLDPDMAVMSNSSGREALATAEGWLPDAILLDVMMPEMDGPTTFGHLQQNPATASIPVIFVTARAQSHEIADYVAMGAVGVIIKPFDPMALAAAVREQVAL